jgi:protein-S-isoprenylcysteine O-methyltransferase Ste14
MNQDSDNLSSDSSNSDNHESDSVEDRKARILSLKEDWAVIPYIALILIGFIVSIVDFVYLQMLVFQLFNVIIGIPILAFGAVMRFLPRKSLSKAGFKSIWKTPYLQIVEDHRLVTDGYYKHIRHPIYLGEIARMFGWVITLSSLYGLLFMIMGSVFLLIRIEVEEKMLIEAFGEEYREYQRKTKKLIPYIY